MKITKKITDDKKQKHNSFELTIVVPTMKLPEEFKAIGAYTTAEEIEYVSHYSSEKEAKAAFILFLEKLSRHYNKHISDFTVDILQ